MPDHLHLLIEGISEDADMKDFVTTVIKYIIENPVRAGLVSDARDYPFWGSQMYSREELLEHISEPAQAGPYDRTG